MPQHPWNDRWTAVRPMALGANDVIAFSGDNTNATVEEDLMPGSPLDLAWGGPCVWHAFTTDRLTDVTVSFCGTAFAQPGAFVDELFMLAPNSQRAVQATTLFPARCGDGNYAMTFPSLPPGTYYIAVGYLSSIAEGDYLVTVSARSAEADMVTR